MAKPALKWSLSPGNRQLTPTDSRAGYVWSRFVAGLGAACCLAAITALFTFSILNGQKAEALLTGVQHEHYGGVGGEDVGV